MPYPPDFGEQWIATLAYKCLEKSEIYQLEFDDPTEMFKMFMKILAETDLFKQVCKDHPPICNEYFEQDYVKHTIKHLALIIHNKKREKLGLPKIKICYNPVEIQVFPDAKEIQDIDERFLIFSQQRYEPGGDKYCEARDKISNLSN